MMAAMQACPRMLTVPLHPSPRGKLLLRGSDGMPCRFKGLCKCIESLAGSPPDACENRCGVGRAEGTPVLKAENGASP